MDVEEDAEHTIWTCTAWESARAAYKSAIESVIHRSAGSRVIKHHREWHKATRNLLIFPEDPELMAAARELEGHTVEIRRRDRIDWEDQPRLDELWEEGRLVVFTDGGCKYPEHSKIRRASFGVFYGEGHAWNFGAPLIGRTQTVPRAELRAALWALEWAQEPTTIVSDNKWTGGGWRRS